MTQVQKMTEHLLLAIEESEEYKRYQNAKKNLCRFPVLKEKADGFLKRKFEFQISGADHFNEGDKLSDEYSDVMEYPAVFEYISAENAFCRLLRQVNWQLLGRLDFDFEENVWTAAK